MALPLEQEQRPARLDAAVAANDASREEARHLARIEAIRADMERLSAQLALLSLHAQLEACPHAELRGFSVAADRLRDVAALTAEASLSGSILRESEDIAALLSEQAITLQTVAWPAGGH
jgi:hypothetical protein